MNDQTRGIFIGMGGFMAGLLAAGLVDWPVGFRALLAVGVAVSISTLLWLAVRRRERNADIGTKETGD